MKKLWHKAQLYYVLKSEFLANGNQPWWLDGSMLMYTMCTVDTRHQCRQKCSRANANNNCNECPMSVRPFVCLSFRRRRSPFAFRSQSINCGRLLNDIISLSLSVLSARTLLVVSMCALVDIPWRTNKLKNKICYIYIFFIYLVRVSASVHHVCRGWLADRGQCANNRKPITCQALD